MTSVATIRATARLSHWLYQHATPVYLLLYGIYKRRSERDAIALIRERVRPGDRVVDIGANVGFYTALLAECVGPRGVVYAFEPDARNFAALSERTRRHPQVHAVHAAVAARSGSIDLYLSPDLNVDHRTYAIEEPRQRHRVHAVALDDFFPADRGSIDFIKMDIQGAEYDALTGMRQLIARSPRACILMELWPYLHERYGPGSAALLSLIDAWGFDAYRIGARGLGPRLPPDAAMPEATEPDAYFDVLCIRRSQIR